MPFITNWMQTWVQLPGAGNDRQPATWLQWWQFLDSIPPDFNQPVFAADFQRWFFTGFGGLLRSGQVAEQFSGQAYINYPPVVGPILLNTLPIVFWSQGNPLPQSKGVIIGRDLAGFYQIPNRYFAVAGVDSSDVDGDSLSSAALATWQIACDTMVSGFLSQGVQFEPVAVSYKHSTATGLYRYHVRPRLGLCHRRARYGRVGYVLPSVPKPPPV